jgi:hypothetical protein
VWSALVVVAKPVCQGLGADEWLVGKRYLSNHSLDAYSIKKTKTDKQRRRTSSPRPEQPTIKPTSYTTSRDLTNGSSTGNQATGWSKSMKGRHPRWLESETREAKRFRRADRAGRVEGARSHAQ